MAYVSQKEIIIIGAGLAGICIAQNYLKKYPEKANDILLLDKGYYAGGRCSSRAVGTEKHLLDFGTFYPVLKEAFNIQAESCTTARQVIQHLTKDLEIHTKKRVKTIIPKRQGWELTLDNNETYFCRQVVITVPVPQAIEMLEHYFTHHCADEKTLNSLKSVHYDRAISLMFADSAFISIIEAQREQLLHSSVRTIYTHDEQGIVLILNALSSLDYWDYSAHELAGILFPDLPLSDDDPDVGIHRWKYAFCQNPLPQPIALETGMTGLTPIRLFCDAIGAESHIPTLIEKAKQFVSVL